MQVDYLIIGQGLSGTFLSWYLINAGKRVLVIDESKPFTATKVASGIINPVTGRRIVRTWRIEELLPFADHAYNQLGKELDADLIKHCDILDFHASLQMKEAFDKRLPDEPFLEMPDNNDEYKSFFNFHYGIGKINACLLVDLNTMLQKWREILKTKSSLLEEEFFWNNCTIESNSVIYKNITAEKIICCEGVAGFDNPYFKNLPYTHMKGEVLIAEIPDLPATNIYKQGISIVPWKDKYFWVGSSYEWKFEDLLPTIDFRNKIEEQLKYFLKVPFKIVDHWAAARPANMERRPFVGLHPVHTAVGLLNGMGTKGCSLAPFFAKQLADHLINNTSIYPDADVRRFEKSLLRQMK